ncbi:MAG: phosphatase PAP2 family protein [Alphaproteobacteria bacterium]|nr:MAG: phosphatase PAP2 family protein [Alphaproteobacteria bacterium]
MNSDLDAKFFRTRRGWARVGWLTAAVALVCVFSIFLVDKPVALWVPDHTSKEWDAVFEFITDLGKAEGYVLAGLLAWGIGYGLQRFYKDLAIAAFYRAFSRLGAFVIASLALSGALIHILKISMGRARPSLLLREDLYGFDLLAFDRKLNSFPSGHSQTIWAVMIPLALVFPAARNWLIGFAVVVASSRVMVSAHFPADVIAGSYMAIMSALYLHQRWFSDLKVPAPRTLSQAAPEEAP